MGVKERKRSPRLLNYANNIGVGVTRRCYALPTMGDQMDRGGSEDGGMECSMLA